MKIYCLECKSTWIDYPRFPDLISSIYDHIHDGNTFLANYDGIGDHVFYLFYDESTNYCIKINDNRPCYSLYVSHDGEQEDFDMSFVGDVNDYISGLMSDENVWYNLEKLRDFVIGYADFHSEYLKNYRPSKCKSARGYAEP